jgi:vacuolar-type H+-ATPase subunit C/Vma6
LEKELIEPFDDDFYLFTAAELRAREKEFIDRSKLDRMIACEDLSDFFKVLSETYYAKYISEIEEKDSFNVLLLGEIRSMAGFLDERLKPEHKIYVWLVFFEEILHNIKLALKADSLDEDLSKLFIPGFLDYKTLRDSVEDAKFEDLDEETSRVIQKGIELKYIEKDIRKREIKLEKFYMGLLYEIISKGRSKIILNFLKGIIDIHNIKNIIRHKLWETDIGFDEFLYENGELDTGFLQKYKNENIENFVRDLENTDYNEMVKKGYEHMSSEESFFYFEKSQDLHLLGLFEDVKYSVSSVERVIAFFIRKKMEIKNLNLIYSSILYETDKDRIKRRLAIG